MSTIDQLLTWPFNGGETAALILLVAGIIALNLLPSEK